MNFEMLNIKETGNLCDDQSDFIERRERQSFYYPM